MRLSLVRVFVLFVCVAALLCGTEVVAQTITPPTATTPPTTNPPTTTPPITIPGTGGVAILPGELIPPFIYLPGYRTGYPTYEYFNESLWRLRDGLFVEAKESLARDLRNSMKLRGVRQDIWLDSICYLAQSAECDFQLGRYDDAQRGFREAIDLYLRNVDWLNHVDSTGNVRPAPRPPVPWGRTMRAGSLADMSQHSFRLRLQSNTFLEGGSSLLLGQQTTHYEINAPEIVRCVALSLRRIGEMLGPIAAHDPWLRSVSDAITKHPVAPGFAQVWVGVLDGLLLAAMEQDDAAARVLNSSLLIESFDHSLTGYALDALGKIALRKKRDSDALQCFLEASYHGFYFRDTILLEESLRQAANVARSIQPKQPVPFVSPATAFFTQRRNANPVVTATLLLESVEDVLLTTGDVRLVDTLLRDAERIATRSMGAAGAVPSRSDMLRAWGGYAAAWNNYHNDKPFSLGPADAKLADAIRGTQQRSLWLYHLRQLMGRFHRKEISDTMLSTRNAMDIYAHLLRDPDERDWRFNTLESLAVQAAITSEPYEHWFTLAIDRSSPESALEIAELARQQRFATSVPGGMRLFSLRILAGAKDAELSDAMRLQRQALALDTGAFANITAETRRVEDQLRGVRAVNTDPAQREKQQSLLAQLERLSLAQELLLRIMAVSRITTQTAFPPQRRIEQLREEMHDEMAILSFFDCMGVLHGFLLDKKDLQWWIVTPVGPREPPLDRLVTNYLDALGMRGNSRPNNPGELTLKELDDTRWRTSGNELLRRLLNGERPATFSELAIVPTGVLWYTPFESMCVAVGGAGAASRLVPILSASAKPLAIRYAPTVALALPPASPRTPTVETVLICGKLSSKDAPELSLDAVERYRAAGVSDIRVAPLDNKNPQYVPLPAAPPFWATQIDRLVVLQEIDVRGGPYDWAPIPLDVAGQRSLLGAWFTLPWDAPTMMVYPGFRTVAETALKSAPAARAGDELFLPAMELFAKGTRTLLMSRWRTGGRTAYDLVGTFIKGAETMPPADAWNSAILDVATRDLNAAEEPRLKTAATDDPAAIANAATHPFFWGGMILIDRGEKKIDAAPKPIL